MRDAISEIKQNLHLGKYQSEAAVSSGIVLRILSSLGWPIYDTNIIIPEYTVEGKRVDFALCHPANKPIIFVEVKSVGKIFGAERQLFEYAFIQGVPMAILTDGQEWNFFLPAEQGEIPERRFYKLDFLERKIEDIVEVIEKYLKYENVKSGKALNSAKQDYRIILKERELVKTLPKAWKRLVEENDKSLVDLIIDKVESLCGYLIDPDHVIDFLSNDLILTSSPTTKIKTIGKGSEPEDPIKKDPRKRKTGFEWNNIYYPAKNAREVMYAALNQFADADPTFLNRFENLPEHGRTRRYVTKNWRDLNLTRPDLAEKYSYEFRKGWFVNINLSKNRIKKVLELACEVAGVRYGKEFKIFLD